MLHRLLTATALAMMALLSLHGHASARPSLGSSCSSCHGSVRLSASTYTVGEAGGTASIQLSRTGSSTGQLRVLFSTQNGTAQAGSDYTNSTQDVSFPGGTTTKTVSVPTTSDSSFEGNETVNLLLSNPRVVDSVTGAESAANAAMLGSPSAAVLTIVDDDPPPSPGTLQFTTSAFSASESGGTATITISRTGGSGGAVTVTLTTSNGTATAGADYTAVNQVVSWTGGDTSTKAVTIPILGDSAFEGNETVNLALSNPTGGATLGSPSAAVLTIVQAGLVPSVSVNQSTFSVGQTLVTTVGLINPGLPERADLYLGILAPDGRTIVFFTSTGGVTIVDIGDPNTFQPVVAGVDLATPFSVTVPAFFSHQWTGTEPRGGYILFLLVVRADALIDGVLAGDEVLGLATAPFAFP